MLQGSELARAASEDALDGRRSGAGPACTLQAGLASCPVHGIRKNVVHEIRGLSAGNKNVSLPLLTALCNDSSLMTAPCTCDPHPRDNGATAAKRLSYTQPPSVTQLLEPGTVARPLSWHSDHLSLEQMQALGQGHTTQGLVNGCHLEGAYSQLSNGGVVNVVPPKLSTGGNSPSNSDSLATHKANLGVA